MTNEYATWIVWLPVWEAEHKMNTKLVSGFHRLLNVPSESAINLISLFWKLLESAIVLSSENTFKILSSEYIQIIDTSVNVDQIYLADRTKQGKTAKQPRS